MHFPPLPEDHPLPAGKRRRASARGVRPSKDATPPCSCWRERRILSSVSGSATMRDLLFPHFPLNFLSPLPASKGIAEQYSRPDSDESEYCLLGPERKGHDWGVPHFEGQVWKHLSSSSNESTRQGSSCPYELWGLSPMGERPPSGRAPVVHPARSHNRLLFFIVTSDRHTGAEELDCGRFRLRWRFPLRSTR